MAEPTAALFEAITAGDPAAVHALLRAHPGLAAARDAQGVSAALHARYRGRADIAAALLAAGPPPDVFDAAAAGDLDALAARLAAAPEQAQARSADGFTALHLAAFFGQPAAAMLLLERGADADAIAANPMRVRPLHSAASARAAPVVAALLARGADPNARQQGELTALMAAAANGDDASIDALLAAGADAAARDATGRTAADYARERGRDAALARLAPRA